MHLKSEFDQELSPIFPLSSSFELLALPNDFRYQITQVNNCLLTFDQTDSKKLAMAQMQSKWQQQL